MRSQTPRLEAEGRLRPAKNAGYLPQRLHPVAGADPNPLSRALMEGGKRALIASGHILGRRDETPVA